MPTKPAFTPPPLAVPMFDLPRSFFFVPFMGQVFSGSTGDGFLETPPFIVEVYDIPLPLKFGLTRPSFPFVHQHESAPFFGFLSRSPLFFFLGRSAPLFQILLYQIFTSLVLGARGEGGCWINSPPFFFILSPSSIQGFEPHSRILPFQTAVPPHFPPPSHSPPPPFLFSHIF